MSSKSNMKFWGGLIVGLLLVGGVGWFLYSRWELNNKTVEEMKDKYAQSSIPVERNPYVSRTNATMAAKESEFEHKVVDRLSITFRAVGLNRVSPGADQELAQNVLSEMKNSTYFDASETKAMGEMSSETPLKEPPAEGGEPPGTFSFKIVAKLKRPLTL